MLDLVGTAEIAELLGVSRQQAHALSQKKGFPDPVATLGGGERPRSFWLRAAVEAWKAESHRPRH
jgi:predicted DNA-binding transcriptional regulator AlpA